jgi:hypothetical protein
VLRLGRTVIGDRVVVGHEELVIALSDRWHRYERSWYQPRRVSSHGLLAQLFASV